MCIEEAVGGPGQSSTHGYISSFSVLSAESPVLPYTHTCLLPVPHTPFIPPTSSLVLAAFYLECFSPRNRRGWGPPRFFSD